VWLGVGVVTLSGAGERAINRLNILVGAGEWVKNVEIIPNRNCSRSKLFQICPTLDWLLPLSAVGFHSSRQAWYNIYQTLFVMFLLCIGTITLSRDANRLVISPIERMVHLVQRLAMDPLARITTHNPAGVGSVGPNGKMAKGGGKHSQHSNEMAGEDLEYWGLGREGSSARLRGGSGSPGSPIGRGGNRVSPNGWSSSGGDSQAGAAQRGASTTSIGGKNRWGSDLSSVHGSVSARDPPPRAGRGGRDFHREQREYKGKGSYETHLLESTLTKIAGLVQIGFGSAGASIIKQNMSHHGAFDPLVRGRKVFAVFGFCDIRKFTDTTECLKEEVMVFTNKIGSIVHNAVHHFEGAANKNIGDAFLMVWKIAKGSADEKRVQLGGGPAHLDAAKKAGVGGAVGGPKGRNAHNEQSMVKFSAVGQNPTMADNALTAFIKCMVDISNSDELAEYRDNRLLMRRFDYPYIVKLGYGLHVGWAIEGAIGSLHKIDASYLSPDVNMSSRLEAATKQFRVPLLMSHSFYNLLSEWNKQHARCIDCVTVKGSTEPLGLYTCDVTRDRILRLNSFEDMELIQEGLHPQVSGLLIDSIDSLDQGGWAINRLNRLVGPG
jgi:class 3 adenylate cyclase